MYACRGGQKNRDPIQPIKTEEKTEKWAVWFGPRASGSGNSVYIELTWAGPGGDNWTAGHRNCPHNENSKHSVFN
jgi:hypothetical protein